MDSDKRAYSIYGPAHFRATWEKFREIAERDGQSASELIRIWVEGYVQRKDPGNPQRPLTAWTPGHPDQEKLQEQDHFAWLKEYAEERHNEVRYLDILRALKEAGVPPVRRPDMADDLARRLGKEKIRVLR